MMHSTSNKRKILERTVAIIFWLAVWHIAALVIGVDMILPSPIIVAQLLSSLVTTKEFWNSVVFSISRMGAGFLLALVVSIILAALSYVFKFAEILLTPVLNVIKAAPVASYIILCLLLMPSRRLSIVISFMMAMPVFYSNILEGLRQTDPKLLEMAKAYEIPLPKRIAFIYFSHVLPYLTSSASVALGLCWKAGIAAEVIGLPRGSIGESLYQAKIYADTKSVLAWSIVVVTISILFEKAFLALLNKLRYSLERR